MTMNKDTLYVKRKRPTDMLLLAAIYVSATLAVALLLGIILYVFVKGIRAVNWAFLTTVTSARKQTTGIAGNLLNTLYIIVITLLIATPIGVGSAIYQASWFPSLNLPPRPCLVFLLLFSACSV